MPDCFYLCVDSWHKCIQMS